MKHTIAAACAAAALAAGAAPEDYFTPQIDFRDGVETFEGPARGCAAGGWTTFKPEGLPKWHGRGGYHSSLWELSRFSGGREQNGKRPSPERVGGKDIPLTDAMKSDVRRFLAETRAAGGSLIVRLGYTWSEQSGCEPADFDIVLGHVRDLSSIMADFPDVVVGVEAGVAGPWAEMHSSDYCRAEYMNRVLDTYCETLPESVSILVRAPGYIDKYAKTDTDGVLAMLPFSDGRLKRIGMFNDGYLGTWWDYGTWAGKWTREKGCKMLSTFDSHPYGGELAYVSMDWLENNREKCGDLFDPARWNIVKDFYDSHLNYLRNIGDKNHSLCKFIAGKTFDAAASRFDGAPDLSEYDGKDLHKFMMDHMGWRFVVRGAKLPKTISRGAKNLVALEIENTGFGRMLLPTRAEIVFQSGADAKSAPVAKADLRQIPGGGRKRMAFVFTAPKDLPAGECSIFARVSAPLSDEEPGAGPRRPVRFANAGMWNEALKANFLGRTKTK